MSVLYQLCEERRQSYTPQSIVCQQFQREYTRRNGIGPIVVDGFAPNAAKSNTGRPLTATVRIGSSDASKTTIAFYDEADFLMAIGDALAETQLSVSSRVKALEALIAALSEIYHKRKARADRRALPHETTPFSGKKGEDCTIM